MRPPIPVLLAVLAAGCGTAHTAPQRTLTTRTETQIVGDVHDPLAKRAVPPPLWLHAAAGAQHGLQGSSCVDYTDPQTLDGTGVCADTPYPAPQSLSVVRPGATVRFDVRGARTFAIDVHPFGCRRRTVRHLTLGPAGRWRVDLRPGLYELIVFVKHFHVGARDGDTSGGLGLWVDRSHALAIVPADSVSVPGCG